MRIIEPTGFAAIHLRPGDRLRVIDIEGGQVADLIAYRRGDKAEWLSNGRSIDYGGTLRFTTGSTLYSNMSRPMLTVEEDEVGRHDFLYTACSEEMYRLQGVGDGAHVNCLDNLRRALAHLDLEPREIPTPFNVFMNVEVENDGTLTIAPPRSNGGDSVCFRAEFDLDLAISACPADLCNGGTQTAIGYEVVPASSPRAR